MISNFVIPAKAGIAFAKARDVVREIPDSPLKERLSGMTKNKAMEAL